MTRGFIIARDTVRADGVRELVEANVRDNYATSPAESVHVFDLAALNDDAILFWCARDVRTDDVLGIGAIKPLSASTAEVKSMRTAEQARGRGIASELLRTMMDDCRQRGLRDLYLETGAEEYFAPARALYTKLGFTETGPFSNYDADPNTVFYTRSLT